MIYLSLFFQFICSFYIENSIKCCHDSPYPYFLHFPSFTNFFSQSFFYFFLNSFWFFYQFFSVCTYQGVRSAMLNFEEIQGSLGNSSLLMESSGHRIPFVLEGKSGTYVLTCVQYVANVLFFVTTCSLFYFIVCF